MKIRTIHANIGVLLCGIILLFLPSTDLRPQTTAGDASAIMQKITARLIHEQLGASESIEDLASRLGITAGELEMVARELDISLDQLRPEVETLSMQMLASDRYRPDVVLGIEGNPAHVLLVEKQTHTIYLVKYAQGQQELVAAYECKTGKQQGDKQVEGDEKTPEGIYFFNAHYKRDHIRSMVGKGNAYEYGEMAFATDYPNRIDRLNDKDGSGIWLHGTDEPFPATSSLDTRGCVVTTNETIRELAQYIQLNRTPMIIVETLTFSPTAEHERMRAEARELLMRWRDSWKAQDIEAYIGCYGHRFTDNGRNLAAWKAYKKNLFDIVTINRIELTNIAMFRHSGGLVIQFDQDYEASNLLSTNTKVLYFMDGDHPWQIIAEHIQR